MNTTNLLDFVEEIIPAAQLVEGVDYEIISFFVFDDEQFEFFPVNHYFGIDALSVIVGSSNGELAERLILQEVAKKTGEDSYVIQPTAKSIHPIPHFYKMSEPIDYDCAISLGFGIVRMINSRKEDDFYLYYFQAIAGEEEDDVDEFDFIHDVYDELLMLRCYLQVTAADFHDPKLANYIDENTDELFFIIFGDKVRTIEKILLSIDRKKGELVLFPR